MNCSIVTHVRTSAKKNKINAETILQALAGLLQHAQKYFISRLFNCNKINAAIKYHKTFI